MKSEALTTARTETFLGDLAELIKLRLSLLVLMTTLVGFLIAWQGPMDYVLLCATLAGTALCASGAGALNQWWERDLDARMKRTRNRPLPAQRMSASDALLFGLFFSVSGLAILEIFTNFRAALLAFITIAIYVLVYTPMKRSSSLNTLVGAIPGALPPLIGWVAATGSYQMEGGLLFALLWFWQMPHFLAIAWMYRDEYADAGFEMLSRYDAEGYATGRQALLYTLGLLLVSLAPALWLFNTATYFYGALFLGAGFSYFAAKFLFIRTRKAARNLFFASIIYLPLILVLQVFTQK